MRLAALRTALWLALGVYFALQVAGLWRGAASWESQPRAATAFFAVLFVAYYLLRFLLPAPPPAEAGGAEAAPLSGYDPSSDGRKSNDGRSASTGPAADRG